MIAKIFSIPPMRSPQMPPSSPKQRGKARKQKRRQRSLVSRSRQRAPEPTPEMRVWQVVAMIPKGKVATYGQVAALAGMPAHARYVGTVLRRLPPDTRLPWHRVVNAGLRSSLEGAGEAEQKRRLAEDGVSFIGQRVARACRWAP